MHFHLVDFVNVLGLYYFTVLLVLGLSSHRIALTILFLSSFFFVFCYAPCLCVRSGVRPNSDCHSSLVLVLFEKLWSLGLSLSHPPNLVKSWGRSFAIIRMQSGASSGNWLAEVQAIGERHISK